MNLFSHRIRTAMVALAGATCLGWAALPPLKVQGNRLVDPQGRVIRLTGVNVPSLDWSATGENVLRSIDVALGDWKANVIRIPLTQDLWFGYSRGTNGARLADKGEGYRKLVDQVVKRIADRNAYVLLDLHWSNGGKWGQYVGQHAMPDELSVVFWKDFAKRYANHPAVLFDLYNEPHSVSWEIWRNGGVIEERNEDPSRGRYLKYRAVGMQTLLETVRATGAKNVVVASGLDWGFDLSGVLKGYALSDKTGRGVVYGTHLYPWKKNREQLVAPVAAKHPIFVGEVGTKPWKEGDPAHENVYTPEWAPAVIDFMDRYQMSYTAWSFHPTANPCIITGWDYQPTAYWGRYVKDALARAARVRAKGTVSGSFLFDNIAFANGPLAGARS